MRNYATLTSVVLFFISSLGVCASSLHVNPVRLHIDNLKTQQTFITLTNRSDDPMLIQVNPMEQEKADSETGQPTYRDTNDLIATPTITKLSPGEKQIIRFGLRQQARGEDKSYRIFFEELPTPERKSSGITMLLRVGVPLTVHRTRPTT